MLLTVQAPFNTIHPSLPPSLGYRLAETTHIKYTQENIDTNAEYRWENGYASTSIDLKKVTKYFMLKPTKFAVIIVRCVLVGENTFQLKTSSSAKNPTRPPAGAAALKNVFCFSDFWLT